MRSMAAVVGNEPMLSAEGKGGGLSALTGEKLQVDFSRIRKVVALAWCINHSWQI